MYIPQKQAVSLHDMLAPGKVIVLYGARRVGKTTLVRNFLERYRRENPGEANRILLVNGDDIIVREFLGSQSLQKLKILSAIIPCWWWMRRSMLKRSASISS